MFVQESRNHTERVLTDRQSDDAADPRSTFVRAFTDELVRSRLTQKTVAELSGVSESYITAIKTGQFGDLGLDVVVALERALNCTPGMLLRHFGFMPVEAGGTAEAGVLGDPEIPERWKTVLVDQIRQIKHERLGGQVDESLPEDPE